MRTITVSPDVFQAIWTARKPGEDSEDAILRRLLLKGSAAKAPPEPERDTKVQTGFHDPRFGVEVPHGFQIYRPYEGKTYRAQAIGGFWIMDGKGYPSLNQLNKQISGGQENAWKAWRYLDDKKRQRPLSDLRDQSKITRRSGPIDVVG